MAASRRWQKYLGFYEIHICYSIARKLLERNLI